MTGMIWIRPASESKDFSCQGPEWPIYFALSSFCRPTLFHTFQTKCKFLPKHLVCQRENAAKLLKIDETDEIDELQLQVQLTR